MLLPVLNTHSEQNAAMAGPKLTLVTRTQGNNQALKDSTVKPKTFEPAYLEDRKSTRLNSSH